MGDYNSPVKVLNACDIGHFQWKCNFGLKNSRKLPGITNVAQKNNNSKIQSLSVSINKNATRQLKVHEKGNFMTNKYRSRLPVVRAIVKEIDEKILEELGPVPEATTEANVSSQIGSMTKLQYLELKKKEFYANCFTREMNREREWLVKNLEANEHQLDDQGQILYQDAVAFNDFIKETDALTKQAVNYRTEETRLLELAKEKFLTNQGKSVEAKKELINMDEKLNIYLGSKSFLLLVLHNSKCRPRQIITLDSWKVVRKSEAYSKLFPRELRRRAEDQFASRILTASRMSISPMRSGMIKRNQHVSRFKSKVPSERNLKKAKGVDVLKFLKEDFSTKMRYPEEWVQDPTFSNSEAEKILPLLGDTEWFIKKVHDLEEANLNFITQFQTYDKKIELSKVQYDTVTGKLSAELKELKERIEIMKDEVEYLEEKASEYKYQSELLLVGANAKGQTIEQSFATITKSISKVYHDIMGDSVQVDPVTMLTKIEFTCYKYFDLMETVGPKIFKDLKKQDKLRRLQEFKEREILAQKLHAEKAKQSQLRSLAKGGAFVGRKLLSRSQPSAKKSQRKSAKDDKEDLSYYFTE